MNNQKPTLSYAEKEAREEEARQRYISKTDFIRSKIGFLPEPQRAHDVDIAEIEHSIKHYEDSYGLNILPDFQRGHVWTREQQISFIESLIVGSVGIAGRIISFNHPAFLRDKSPESDLDEMVCVDGLQRLTAIREFVKGEFTVFEKELGGVDCAYFNGSIYSLRSQTVKFQVFNMQTKKELLGYYLKFNKGGTAHSKEELERVQAMYDALP